MRERGPKQDNPAGWVACGWVKEGGWVKGSVPSSRRQASCKRGVSECVPAGQEAGQEVPGNLEL